MMREGVEGEQKKAWIRLNSTIMWLTGNLFRSKLVQLGHLLAQWPAAAISLSIRS